MAVVAIMSAASAHHPSLRPRRPSSSSASWTSSTAAIGTAARPAAEPASTVDQRQYQQILATRFNDPPPSSRRTDAHSMHGSRGRSTSRAGSVSSSSRSPSSQSSQLSDSPRVRLNGYSHLGHIAASGEEGPLLSVGGHGSGTMTTVGGQRMRRPRRRADEVERLYKCIWNGCEKSYGTLSHLNDHVRLQRHGTKREPHEFKEARRIWRQERKSRRLREHAIQGGPNSSPSSVQHMRLQSQHLVPATASVSSFSTSNTEGVNTTIQASLQARYRPNYARPEFFAADESSPEDAQVDGDFDRERTPLTPPIGSRIAVATSSYHTYSRPISSQNPTISSLPPYSLPAAQRNFTNEHLDLQTEFNIHEHTQGLSAMQSAQAHQSPGETHEPPKNGFRLPSIAELRLDLTLDEYEAHSALGSLSNAPVARPSSATASTEQHPQRGMRNRRRDSWDSPHTSPSASVTGPLSPAKFQSRPHALAPPPPYYLYPNGHDNNTNATQSPDFTNQYKFRITSGASSPSMERPPSRSPNPNVRQQQQQQQATSNYTRSRTMSHSRHPSSSRPSTSTTTSTSQSYHLSTPAPSNFPFIPAQPHRTTPEASEGEPRRKRRKYEEIERRYHCGWNGCTKAYGTLNHLNDHVSLQGHGNKRRGSEFS